MAKTQKTYNSNSTAVWAGIKDLKDKTDPPYDQLLPEDRMDGRTVLLTGASSGLGFALAKELTSRGARVLMVCRRDAAEELAEVRRAGAEEGGSAELLRADMADFSSIRTLVGELVRRGEHIDVAISNAAVVPGSARTTVDGFEEMLQVNALAPALLMRELLYRGVIPNNTYAGNGRRADSPIPRIVVVASEAHRSADALNLEDLNRIEPYGMAESTPRYGWTKLWLLTYARELARKLAHGADNRPDVSVNALCPGPIASNIAREAPAVAQPFAKLFFALFFQAPRTAALPVAYLAASSRIEGETMLYQFLMRKRAPSDIADSPDNGRKLWETLEEIFSETERRYA